MPYCVESINPYEAPTDALALELHHRSMRPAIRLSKMSVLSGLVFASLIFGISFTGCMIVFERLSTYFVGSSPLGAPTGNEITQAAGVFSIFGFAASLLTVPLLMLMNSKARLDARWAFAIMALLGTVAFIVIANASSPLRPLTPLSPFTSKMITFACVLWVPSLMAAIVYAVWIDTLRKRIECRNTLGSLKSKRCFTRLLADEIDLRTC